MKLSLVAFVVHQASVARVRKPDSTIVRMDNGVVGSIQGLPLPLVGKHRDRPVMLVSDHSSIPVLAGDLPPLKVEGVPVAVARRVFKTEEDLQSRYDPEVGTIEVFAVKRIVESVEKDETEMSLSEALEIDETFIVGDYIEIPKPTLELGRIAAQTAKQVLKQKVREAEREIVFDEFSEQVGQVVNGIVRRIEGRDIILDIGRTLEYMETSGVTVVGYKTNEFPSFYSRRSGFQGLYQVDSAETIANIHQENLECGLLSALLVANPIQKKDEIPAQDIEKIITSACFSALKNNISGKKLTPYLLAEIVRKTNGRSLDSNRALALNNVALGAEISLKAS